MPEPKIDVPWADEVPGQPRPLHAGLAFGAFHRWIYKPAKAGELSHPLEHKFTTVTVSSIKSQATAAGQPITEQTPATPSG